MSDLDQLWIFQYLDNPEFVWVVRARDEEEVIRKVYPEGRARGLAEEDEFWDGDEFLYETYIQYLLNTFKADGMAWRLEKTEVL